MGAGNFDGFLLGFHDIQSRGGEGFYVGRKMIGTKSTQRERGCWPSINPRQSASYSYADEIECLLNVDRKQSKVTGASVRSGVQLNFARDSSLTPSKQTCKYLIGRRQ